MARTAFLRGAGAVGAVGAPSRRSSTDMSDSACSMSVGHRSPVADAAAVLAADTELPHATGGIEAAGREGDAVGSSDGIVRGVDGSTMARTAVFRGAGAVGVVAMAESLAGRKGAAAAAGCEDTIIRGYGVGRRAASSCFLT